AAIKMSTDFNAAMADVATLIPRNTDLVAGMKKEVQDLAVATGKSTTDLARGLYQVISAGVDARDAMSVLGVAARAAAAGLTDTNTAVDAITSTLNAYGLSADKASQVSDVLLTTVRLGKTTFGELGATIGRVIPIAAQTGVSFEDLNAAIVATTAVGLDTAEAVTGIRAALNNILKPSKQASELAASLGLQFDAQALKAKGLIPMLQEIVKATKGDTEAMTALFGSVEGVNAVLALTSEQGMAKMLAAQQEMQNAVGATDLAFKTQTEGINATGFALAQLQQKAAVTAQNFGDALAPSLSRVLDAAQPLLNAIKGLVDRFANLNPGLQTAIIAAVGLAAAVGPLVLVVGQAMQLFSALAGVAGLLSGAFSFLLGPAGLVVAAIGAIVAIGVVLYRNWDEISAWLTATWSRIRDAAL
ncbi:MAG: phage tail tape measure protein, partial [Thermoleophilia bacterium]|nr:phage tail tape measure protein [Thermoleophilia bacterium]